MSTYCIGNGKVCVYSESGNMLHAFGPSYSSPDAFSLECKKSADVKRLGIGLWGISSADGEYTDFADAEKPVLYRRVISGQADFFLRFCNCENYFKVPDSISPDSYMSVTQSGVNIYTYEFSDGIPHGYTSSKIRYFGVRTLGGIITPADKGVNLSGSGDFIFAFSDTPDELFELLSSADAEGAYKAALHKSNVIKARLLLALDGDKQKYADAVFSAYDTVVSQQSISGGVLAGCNYHLCYLRDNYGVYRGLRAMGAYDEARKLCEYYLKVFKQYGKIHNAQGPDEYAFHVHENDSVEITGYLALMLLDCGSVRNGKYADTARSALEYCLLKQHEQLRNGILPFNGDETYIAGGILPRSAMNDGSLEATALYHRALQLTLDMAETDCTEVPAFYREDFESIENSFDKHFLVNGRYVCNCPGFYENPPKYRHGVRACGHGFGLAFRNKNGDYVCHSCLDKNIAPCYTDYGRLYDIPSALLCPAYIHSTLINPEKAKTAACEILSVIEKCGKSVGYDYGFILYVTGYNNEIAEKMLSQRDSFGAWNEYYIHGAASGTPCRPWETGVCLSALLKREDYIF